MSLLREYEEYIRQKENDPETSSFLDELSNSEPTQTSPLQAYLIEDEDDEELIQAIELSKIEEEQRREEQRRKEEQRKEEQRRREAQKRKEEERRREEEERRRKEERRR